MNYYSLVLWAIVFLVCVIGLLLYTSWLVYVQELKLKEAQEEIEYLEKDLGFVRQVVRAILYKMKGDYFTLEERTALNIILTGSDGLGGE